MNELRSETDRMRVVATDHEHSRRLKLPNEPTLPIEPAANNWLVAVATTDHSIKKFWKNKDRPEVGTLLEINQNLTTNYYSKPHRIS